jgi:glycosyltransferase involved in cell wall biosynthesis
MKKKEQNKEIVFVSHTAGRSGAPLILLGLLKQFRSLSPVPFQIVLMQDGELRDEFLSLGKVHMWPENDNKKFRNLLAGNPSALFTGLVKRIKKLAIVKQLRNTKLAVFNTVAPAEVHEQLLSGECKFIYYVHELEMAIQKVTDPYKRNIIFGNTDFFLAGSEAVKKNLVKNHLVPGNRIKVIHSSVKELNRSKEQYMPFVFNFKKNYNIPDDAVIIGAAANAEWRKGFDWFMPLTSIYFQMFPDSEVFFVWKGLKESNTAEAEQRAYDHERFENRDRIILLPHDRFSIEQIACFDINLLLSREDPYPLAVLEAASFGIPTIAFDDAGGSPEFIETDCGFTVPYGNLYEMAAKLNALVENKQLRTEMGNNARLKVEQRHNEQHAAKEFAAVIQNFLHV